MGGSLRRPKSLGVVDQPLAEVPVPDPVDQHPGRQRVLGVDDRLGQLEPAAPLLERAAARARRATLRNCRGTALPGRPGLPRRKTCGSTGLGASFITIARAGAAGCVAFSRSIDRLVELRRTRCRSAPVEHEPRVGPSASVERAVRRRSSAWRSDSHSGSARRCAAGSLVLLLRASSWPKSSTYRATTSSMLGRGPIAEDASATSGWTASAWPASVGRAAARPTLVGLGREVSGGRAANAARGRAPGRSSGVGRLEAALPEQRSRPGAARDRACRPRRARRAWVLRASSSRSYAALRYTREPLAQVVLDLVPTGRRGSRRASSWRLSSLPRELDRVRGRRRAGPFQHGQVVRLDRAGEDAVERVIVVGRDRVELVVVAAGAGDRQAEQAAADDVDPVVDDLVLVVEEPAADGQEPQRRQRAGARRPGSSWSAAICSTTNRS